MAVDPEVAEGVIEKRQTLFISLSNSSFVPIASFRIAYKSERSWLLDSSAYKYALIKQKFNSFKSSQVCSREKEKIQNDATKNPLVPPPWFIALKNKPSSRSECVCVFVCYPFSLYFLIRLQTQWLLCRFQPAF